MDHPPIVIRTATVDDAAACLHVYAPFITDSTVSFETEVPTVDTFAERIAQCNRNHRWIVAEQDGALLGYAYGGSHRAREAYRYSTETSVYLAPQSTGKGLGAQLYNQLFSDLAELGYFHAYAGIAMPNEPSERLHQKLGFVRLGEFPNVGYKQGRWHSVSWWYRKLREGMPE